MRSYHAEGLPRSRNIQNQNQIAESSTHSCQKRFDRRDNHAKAKHIDNEGMIRR